MIFDPERVNFLPRKKMLFVLPVQNLAPVFFVMREPLMVSEPERSLLT